MFSNCMIYHTNICVSKGKIKFIFQNKTIKLILYGNESFKIFIFIFWKKGV